MLVIGYSAVHASLRPDLVVQRDASQFKILLVGLIKKIDLEYM
jgi:hypothetical protein